MAAELRPGEEIVQVKPVGIIYRCPFCNEGYMEVTMDPVVVPAVLRDPPEPIMRTHRCSKCNKTMQLPGAYPMISWEVVREEESNETQSSEVPVDGEKYSS